MRCPETRADTTKSMTEAPTILQISLLERPASRASDITMSSPNSCPSTVFCAAFRALATVLVSR